MKCKTFLRRKMCWQRKRLDWDGPLVREQQGKGIQENSSATWFIVSGFMAMALVSRLSLANHLAYIWSESGSFLVACTPLSQDGFQHEGFWDVGRTILWVGVSFFLLAPPTFSWLVYSSSTVFLFRASCFEIIHASGYHYHWLRQTISVNGLLTKLLDRTMISSEDSTGE